MKEKTNIKTLEDAALINFYKSTGDTTYVGALFERYTHLVFGVCMKYLKNEDKAKDAFMSIFENLFSDLKKHSITNFKGWLYSVSKNHCLMMLRKNKMEVPLIEATMEKVAAEHPDYKIELENRLNLLNEAIQDLEEQQQACIRLFYIEEKTYQQIEKMTGFEFKQVKSFIQNGKRNLKIYMQKNEPQ